MKKKPSRWWDLWAAGVVDWCWSNVTFPGDDKGFSHVWLNSKALVRKQCDCSTHTPPQNIHSMNICALVCCGENPAVWTDIWRNCRSGSLENLLQFKLGVKREPVSSCVPSVNFSSWMSCESVDVVLCRWLWIDSNNGFSLMWKFSIFFWTSCLILCLDPCWSLN